MSSGRQTLDVELPPEGTLSRDLVRVTLNLLLLTEEVEVHQRGTALRVVGDLQVALKTVSNLLHRVLDFKSGVRIRWPPLHQNDKGTLKKSKLVASKIGSMDTYGDLAREYISYLPDLARAGTVKFRGGEIALLQLLKVEFYETGLTFNMPYRYEAEFKTNDGMLSLLLAGLAAAYTGYIEILVPGALGDVCAARTYMAIELAGLSMGRVPSDPTIPYVFYNHIVAHRLAGRGQQVLQGFSDVIDPSKGFCLEQASFVVHRLSYTGRTYTEMSREEIRISRELLDFVGKLDGDECLNEFIDLVRVASGAEDPAALNSLVFLYEAVNRASDPAFASYYLARVLTEMRLKRGRAPVGGRCFRRALEALLG